jgi:RNA polymerase sigma-70 factor (ECF subfamily)
VAKNKAKNYFHRSQYFFRKNCRRYQRISSPQTEESEINLSDENITDSQLQMLFAICHPSIPTEAQIGLALRILCGFGINEIATAFLTNNETINKRLFQGKRKIEDGKSNS